jgi:hypothetical protein
MAARPLVGDFAVDVAQGRLDNLDSVAGADAQRRRRVGRIVTPTQPSWESASAYIRRSAGQAGGLSYRSNTLSSMAGGTSSWLS